MIFEKLPPEIWKIIEEILNRTINECGDSIELKFKHPIRYEILFNRDGTIRDIRECFIM